MDFLIIAAYLLPIAVLMVLIGRVGKKSGVYLFWGFLASIPVYFLYIGITAACAIPTPEVTVSPVIEELFKALPIIIPALMGIGNRDDDVLFCAMASGIGFSLVENWNIIGPANIPFSSALFLGVLARSFSTSVMHGCTCGIIGYGVVLIRNFDRNTLPVLLFGFYTIAVTTHALYNLLFGYYGIAGAVIDLVFPLFLFLLLLTCYRVDISSLFKKSSAR